MREIVVHGVHPVHPGRGQPSYIALSIGLLYLKDKPYEEVVISSAKAIELIEELARAVRVTTKP